MERTIFLNDIRVHTHTYAYKCIQMRTDAYKYIQLHTNARTVLTFAVVDRIWRDAAASVKRRKTFPHRSHGLHKVWCLAKLLFLINCSPHVEQWFIDEDGILCACAHRLSQLQSAPINSSQLQAPLIYLSSTQHSHLLLYLLGSASLVKSISAPDLPTWKGGK